MSWIYYVIIIVALIVTSLLTVYLLMVNQKDLKKELEESTKRNNEYSDEIYNLKMEKIEYGKAITELKTQLYSYRSEDRLQEINDKIHRIRHRQEIEEIEEINEIVNEEELNVDNILDEIAEKGIQNISQQKLDFLRKNSNNE